MNLPSDTNEMSQSIARDELFSGAILISTVRLAEIADSTGGSYPYESIVVVDDQWIGAEQPRWQTLEQAQEGHRLLLDKWGQAKPAYCFDCADNKDNDNQRAWILGDDSVYCAHATWNDREHLVCAECLPAYHCDLHPNWCVECEPGQFCEMHRSED